MSSLSYDRRLRRSWVALCWCSTLGAFTGCSAGDNTTPNSGTGGAFFATGGSNTFGTGGASVGAGGGVGNGGILNTAGGRVGAGGLAISNGGANGTGGAIGTGGVLPGTGGVPAASGGSANTGGANTGGVGGGNTVPPGTVCDRLATAQCTAEAACCTSPGRTIDACKQTIKTSCTNDLYVDAISLNTVSGYDAAHAGAAFAEFEQRAATCDVTIAAWAVTVDGLRGIARGTRAAGADCTAPNALTNRAEAAAFLASCQNPATTACLPGLFVAWKCTARSAQGGPCFTDVNCADGLFCDNPSGVLPPGPTCKTRKPDTSSCTFGNECGSFTCKNNSCVPATVQTAYCLMP